jgi:hypothetical protein
MLRPLPLLLALGACGSNAPPAEPTAPAEPTTPAEPTAPTEPTAPASAPTYEVHEWGLVRRAFPDRVIVSGPPGTSRMDPMPVAKPVLYFHRDGEGSLAIDVDVAMPSGHVVEQWPLTTTTPTPSSIRWADVALVEGHCRGSRYPRPMEPPCSAVPDFCEAAELATVEAEDGDCVHVDGQPFDHLFYRGEVTSPPTFPLELALEGDVLRVTHRGRAPIPGKLVRVRRSGAAVSVVDAPSPGTSVTLPPPRTANGEGARALAESLRSAGLTDAEAQAFARAWDVELFGALTASVTTIPPAPSATSPSTAPSTASDAIPAAMPMGAPADDALLYVLPTDDAAALATLRFDPPPRVVRRAIVAWIDVALGRPVQR